MYTDDPMAEPTLVWMTPELIRGPQPTSNLISFPSPPHGLTPKTQLPSLPASGQSLSLGLLLVLTPQAPLIGTGDKKEHVLVHVISISIYLSTLVSIHSSSIHPTSIWHPTSIDLHIHLSIQHPSDIICPLIYPTCIIPFIHPSSTHHLSIHLTSMYPSSIYPTSIHPSSIYPSNVHSPFIIHIPQHLPIHATSIYP